MRVVNYITHQLSWDRGAGEEYFKIKFFRRRHEMSNMENTTITVVLEAASYLGGPPAGPPFPLSSSSS